MDSKRLLTRTAVMDEQFCRKHNKVCLTPKGHFEKMDGWMERSKIKLSKKRTRSYKELRKKDEELKKKWSLFGCVRY